MRPYTAVQKVKSKIQAFAYQWHHQVTSSLTMPLIGERLNFRFYFLNSSLRPHHNNFMLLLITLLKDNMNRLYKDISYTLILLKNHIL